MEIDNSKTENRPHPNEAGLLHYPGGVKGLDKREGQQDNRALQKLLEISLRTFQCLSTIELPVDSTVEEGAFSKVCSRVVALSRGS